MLLVILGASGFIGSQALRQAVAAGGQVYGVVQSPAGSILAQTVTLDVAPDHSRLVRAGFQFTYPSPRDGLPPTLAALGYQTPHCRCGGIGSRHQT